MRNNFDSFPAPTRAGDALDYTRGHKMSRNVYSDVKKAGIGKEHVGQTAPEGNNLGKVFRGGKWIDIRTHNANVWAGKKKG